MYVHLYTHSVGIGEALQTVEALIAQEFVDSFLKGEGTQTLQGWPLQSVQC